MRIRIHHLMILGLLLGTGIGSYTMYHKQVTARDNRPVQIRQENSRVQTALNRLGKQDGGEADLTYYRNGHILAFSVTDFNVRGKFKDDNLHRQMAYFEHSTKILKVIPQVSLTKKAMHHHQIQLNEQKKQRKENHREAVEAIQQAHKEAKERAEQAKKKQEAKAKAKREAKEKAQRQARQQQELEKKKAEQHDKKAKRHSSEK